MLESADRKCYYCNTPEMSRNHLRPYGPNGALICFDCMKADPKREAEAERQFGAMLEHAGIVGDEVVTLTDAGLIPGNISGEPKKVVN